jgi:hypothetical protein
MFAENPMLLVPAGIVTDDGTVTALLLLVKFTEKPPTAAAEFNVTVQRSLPAPVIEALTQLNPVSVGTPEPLRLTTEDGPLEESLLIAI